MFCLHFQLVFWPSSGEDIAQTQHTLAVPPKGGSVLHKSWVLRIHTNTSCTHSLPLVNHIKIQVHLPSLHQSLARHLLPVWFPSCHVHSTWKHKSSGSHDTDLSGTCTSLQCIQHFANPQGLWISATSVYLSYQISMAQKWNKQNLVVMQPRAEHTEAI